MFCGFNFYAGQDSAEVFFEFGELFSLEHLEREVGIFYCEGADN
jgi:hypothetical protein